MSEPPAAPRVTIGIPLYAARPWIERIAGNIERNLAPGVELLLADQHGLDDTVPALQARYGHLPQVRFHAGRDRLNWIGNYNFLLREARGDYFRILAQDDELDPASLAAAVAALDADPRTVLVVGPADLIDVAGEVLQRDERLPASRPPTSALGAAVDSLLLFAGRRYANANLGLVRRRLAVESDLTIPPTAGETGLSVRAWLFALSLRGRVRYLPEYASRLCVHPQSYTARHWRRSPGAQVRRALSYLRAGAAAWCRVHRGPARLLGLAGLAMAGLVVMPLSRILSRLTGRFRRARAALTTG